MPTPSNSVKASHLGRMSREHALRTAAWVAEFLGVAEAWVTEATAAGTLPCIRVGDAVRFDPAVIKAWGRPKRPAVEAPVLEADAPEPVLAVLNEIREALVERDAFSGPAAPAVTIKEAMRRLGCGRVQVFKLLKSGVLQKAQSVGRKTLITSASIDELLRTPAENQPSPRHRRRSAGTRGWTPMDVRKLRG